MSVSSTPDARTTSAMAHARWCSECRQWSVPTHYWKCRVCRAGGCVTTFASLKAAVDGFADYVATHDETLRPSVREEDRRDSSPVHEDPWDAKAVEKKP